MREKSLCRGDSSLSNPATVDSDCELIEEKWFYNFQLVPSSIKNSIIQITLIFPDFLQSLIYKNPIH